MGAQDGQERHSAPLRPLHSGLESRGAFSHTHRYNQRHPVYERMAAYAYATAPCLISNLSFGCWRRKFEIRVPVPRSQSALGCASSCEAFELR